MVTRKRCVLCNHEDRYDIEHRVEELHISTDIIDREYDWPSGTTSRHQRNHMGEYVNASNPKCGLCVSPIRKELEEQLHAGNMTPLKAAEIVGCSEEQIVRHVKNHLQPLVQQSAANIIAVKEIDEIETLERNIGRLDTMIESLFDEGSTDPKSIDSLTKLAREIRESLKYVMEFKGKLVHKRQDTIIVAQMQIVQEVLAQNHPDVWLDVRNKMEEKLQ